MDKERTVIDLENFKIGHSITHDDLLKDSNSYAFIPKFYYIEEHKDYYACFDLTKKAVKNRYLLKIGSEVYNMEDIEIKCQVHKRYTDINKNLIAHLIVRGRDTKSKTQWWYSLKLDEKSIVSYRFNFDLYETEQSPIFDIDTDSEVGFICNKKLINKN